MKAARLHEGALELEVEEVEEPRLQPGCAIVRVEACFLSPSVSGLLGGGLGYTLPPRPFTPGMDTIGTVEAVADDVGGLEPGMAVYCDHFWQSHNVTGESDACFLGYFGVGPAAGGPLSRFPDGGFAEKMVLPAECMTPAAPALAKTTPEVLCRLGWIGTAYGALVKAGLKAGDSVVVNGATGLVGSSGVLLARAMGATRIVAIGRKREVLDALEEIDSGRIVAVAPADEIDAAAEIAAAAGGADIVLDAVGATDDPHSTMAALQALKRGGAGVVVGGLSAELPVDYRWLMVNDLTLRGSLWFPRRAAAEMIAMIGAGLLDLSAIEARRRPLDDVNAAVAEAAERPGGLTQVALCP